MVVVVAALASMAGALCYLRWHSWRLRRASRQAYYRPLPSGTTVLSHDSGNVLRLRTPQRRGAHRRRSPFLEKVG